MARKDVYQVDNYLVAIGWVLLVVGALSMAFDPGLWNEISVESKNGNTTSYTFEARNGRSLQEIQREKGEKFVVRERTFPLTRSIIAANGLILLLVGYAFRAREKKVIAIWKALESTGAARVSELSANLGLSRDFILRHLKDINAHHRAGFTYDGASDKILDRRLTAEFLVTADCAGCGTQISQSVSLDLSKPPRCPSCGAGVPADHLNELKRQALLTMAAAPEDTAAPFNVVLFVALLVFVWPGALVYLAYKKGWFRSSPGVRAP